MKLQINAITKNKYNGHNQAELLQAKETEGYTSNEWVTYLQAKSLGKKLENAKGKGVHILKVQPDDEDTDKKFIRTYCVFNTDLLVDIKKEDEK